MIKAATAVELTHLGTLYHDDVMDAAGYRRGVRSVYELWGASVAVRTGDFLFARSSGLVSELGDHATRLHARTFLRLVEGQTAETAGPRPDEATLDHHLTVLSGKTASLFSYSGHLGSLVGGAPDDVIESVDPACEAWGLAYQLSDDVLDVTSESGEIRKLPGADLRQGVLTLPSIYAIYSAQPYDARLVELLQHRQLEDLDLHAEALQLLRAHPAIDRARAEARRWTETAKTRIFALPDSPARCAFDALCDFVVASGILS